MLLSLLFSETEELGEEVNLPGEDVAVVVVVVTDVWLLLLLMIDDIKGS